MWNGDYIKVVVDREVGSIQYIHNGLKLPMKIIGEGIQSGELYFGITMLKGDSAIKILDC